MCSKHNVSGMHTSRCTISYRATDILILSHIHDAFCLANRLTKQRGSRILSVMRNTAKSTEHGVFVLDHLPDGPLATPWKPSTNNGGVQPPK
jgi:hypothetical protein